MGKLDLSVVDLFAGCGGLGLGLEQAGFVPVFVNELNNDARSTYIKNREDDYEWLADPGYQSSDVRKMVGSKYLTDLESRLKNLGIDKGELGLVVGGPPAKDFQESAIADRIRSTSVNFRQTICIATWRRSFVGSGREPSYLKTCADF